VKNILYLGGGGIKGPRGFDNDSTELVEGGWGRFGRTGILSRK